MYSETSYSYSSYRMEAKSLFELPVRSLKINTTSAWVTVQVYLSRIEDIISLNCIIFSHVKSLKWRSCFSERLKSAIFSCSVESHFIARFSIILFNSEALTHDKWKYTWKLPRSLSKNRFFINSVRQHWFPASIWIFLLIFFWNNT